MTPAPLWRGFLSFWDFSCRFFCFALCLCGIMQLEVRNVVAIVVRAIRRQKGWDRKQMAKILGVSAACIGRVERGEQKLEEDAAKRLCKATGVKLSRIF